MKPHHCPPLRRPTPSAEIQPVTAPLRPCGCVFLGVLIAVFLLSLTCKVWSRPLAETLFWVSCPDSRLAQAYIGFMAREFICSMTGCGRGRRPFGLHLPRPIDPTLCGNSTQATHFAPCLALASPCTLQKTKNLFFLVQTKMSWRTLLVIWFSRQPLGFKVQSCPVLQQSHK